MKHIIIKAEVFFVIVLAILCVTCACMAQEDEKGIDPCALLTKAEIEAAVGQKAGEGKLNSTANPQVGAPCQYTIGSGGAFSILAKKVSSGETAGKVMDELKKMNIAVSDAANVGDQSFFSSPGYGMIQLNTFKGSHYLIVTMLVPGATEANQKTAAVVLMNKALKKL